MYREKPRHLKPLGQTQALLSDRSAPAQWGAYRALASLFLSEGVREQRAFAVAGVRREAVHAEVCANLAITLSSVTPVLLIDACLYAPRQQELFQIPNSRGLSDVLAGRCTLVQAVQKNVRPSLAVLPAGSWAAETAVPIAPVGMPGLLEEAQASCGILLLNCPPVCGSPDSLLAAPYTAGVLLVVCKDMTRSRELDRALSALEAVRAPVLGSVLVSGKKKISPFDC